MVRYIRWFAVASLWLALSTPAIPQTYPGLGLFNGWLFANDFGAVCDGVTDDSTAFKNMISAAQTLGARASWRGNCGIGSTLTITATLDFGGTGVKGYPGTPVPNGLNARLTATTTNFIVLKINTDSAVHLHDFDIKAHSGDTTGTGILLTSAGTLNEGSLIQNVMVDGFGICFDTGAAANWFMDEVAAQECPSIGIRVQDTFNVDAGDSTITNSFIGNQPGGAAAGIQMLSSGGLRVINNKINTVATWCFQLNLVSGAATGDLFITGNSMEGCPGSIELIRQGTTGATTFQLVTITGNELTGKATSNCFLSTDPNGTWLFTVTITGNVCTISDAAGAGNFTGGFTIEGGLEAFTIANNVTRGGGSNASTYNIFLSGTLTYCVIGPNLTDGPPSASTLPGNGCGVGKTTYISPN